MTPPGRATPRRPRPGHRTGRRAASDLRPARRPPAHRQHVWRHAGDPPVSPEKRRCATPHDLVGAGRACSTATMSWKCAPRASSFHAPPLRLDLDNYASFVTSCRCFASAASARCTSASAEPRDWLVCSPADDDEPGDGRGHGARRGGQAEAAGILARAWSAASPPPTSTSCPAEAKRRTRIPWPSPAKMARCAWARRRTSRRSSGWCRPSSTRSSTRNVAGGSPPSATATQPPR